MRKQDEEKLLNMLLANMNNNEEEAIKLLKKCKRDKTWEEFYFKNLNPNFYRNRLLAKAIAEEDNILDLTKNFASNLVAVNQLFDRELANWALWFGNITTDSDTRNYWRYILNEIHALIKNNYPDVIGEVVARIKSLIGGWSKETKFKNLSKTNDIYGGRFVLRANNHESPEELVCTLYRIVKDVIELVISEGLSMLAGKAEKNNKNFSITEHPSLIIPDKKTTTLLKEYSDYVKDYIAKPKDDGYQSIHIIFVHPIYGQMEMQFRTLLMDDYAEKGPASHKKYKDLNPLYNFLMKLARNANSDWGHLDFIGITDSEEFHHRYLRYSAIKKEHFPKDILSLPTSNGDLSFLNDPSIIY